MKLVYTLDALPKESAPIAITMGTFDGVHKGHQQILKALHGKGKPYLITFNCHPHKTLASCTPPFITTLQHKLALLERAGIERCYLLDFTEEFSKQSPKEFLILLKKHLNFSSLILGYDAKIGYQRSGDEACIKKLAQELDFQISYIPPYYVEQELVSSSLIRTLIKENRLQQAEPFLGREYSILSRTVRGAKKGHLIGYPTANLNIEGLIYPKQGVWSCTLLHNNISYQAIANLGHAPTLHKDRECLLEVHLLDNSPNLYDTEVEVFFKKYIREEKSFTTPEELKAQINKDISTINYYESFL